MPPHQQPAGAANANKPPPQPSAPRTGIYDEICQKWFPNFDVYHKHKLSSKKHITCEKCSQDFNTREAAKLHHDQFHSKEQDLKCNGCGKQFTRLGGLVSHLELTECHFISKQRFDSARKQMSLAWEIELAAHRQENDRGGTSGSLGINPLGKQLTSSWVEPAQPKAPTFSGNDLMSFDIASDILGAEWNVPLPAFGPTGSAPRPAPANDTADFPGLPRPAKVQATISPAVQIPNAWDDQKNLFPNAPPAEAPPTELLAALGISQPKPVVPPVNPFDPDIPGFHPQRYYNEILRKYLCPYNNCTKSMPSTNAFIQHLKSPAHRQEKLQCNTCLHYFDTATALTQHSESQGLRCKVRDHAAYDGVVSKITAGTAAVVGRHVEDMTVKYAVVNGLLQPYVTIGHSIAQANKEVAAEIDKAKGEYWVLHSPKW